MIRLIALGVWVCLVTMVSSYAATLWKTQTTPEVQVEKLFGGLQSVKTSLVSVPIVSDGGVQGYVIAQFSFTIKADVLRRMSVKPDVFLLDSAFRTIYSADAAAVRGAKKQDLQSLTAGIKSHVNERFGNAFVEDVLIERFSYVPKDEVRNGAKLTKLQPDLVP
jgi:hypothetical protein